MDVLDTNNIQGYYLVMDNVPIHTPARVRNLIENRYYNKFLFDRKNYQ